MSKINKNTKINIVYSWPVVIIAMIVFWPVGLFLLFRKFSVDKSATLKNSKIVAVIGWVLIGIAIIYILAAATGGLETTEGANVVSDVVLAIVLFGGGGAGLLIASKKMKKSGMKYKKYIDIVINQGQTNINNISSITNIPFEEVYKDIEKMIDVGFFENAYIREDTKEIILKKEEANTSIVSKQTKVVVCKSCGANNTVVVGQTSECEYCGSPIQ